MIKPLYASLRWRLSASVFFGLLVLLIGVPGVQAQWTTNGNNINNTNTGNVGVGTTTPPERLTAVVNDAVTNGITHVLSVGHDTSGTPAAGLGAGLLFRAARSNGDLAASSYIASVWEDPTAGTEDGALLFATMLNSGGYGTERMRITSSGNVGIGTTSPADKLHVAGGTRVDGTNGRVYLGTTAPTNARGLEIIEENATTFSLRHHDPNVAWQNIVINPHGGNVGIGTLSPTTKLHVAGDGKVTGNLTVDGNIAAKYQDVAEWVPAARSLPPGTVVTLNPSQSNFVEASSKAYDTSVAGVISAQPGITLGERSENKVLVATTGRVKVKVDATNAPIQIGDLLVTSEQEGIAMKSVPVDVGGVKIHRPGTIIGKALEPLTKGQGEILVLLSLQ